jgi:predicted GIY-YIG superfamily endonuclease
VDNFLYKFLNSQNEIIYIGKTRRLKRRLKQEHFTSNGHLPHECYNEVTKIFYSELSNSDELSIYERYLINKYNPKYNDQYNNNSTFNFELPDIEWKEFNREKPQKKIKTKKENPKKTKARQELKELSLEETVSIIINLVESKDKYEGRIGTLRTKYFRVYCKENNYKEPKLLESGKKSQVCKELKEALIPHGIDYVYGCFSYRVVTLEEIISLILNWGSQLVSKNELGEYCWKNKSFYPSRISLEDQEIMKQYGIHSERSFFVVKNIASNCA